MGRKHSTMHNKGTISISALQLSFILDGTERNTTLSMPGAYGSKEQVPVRFLLPQSNFSEGTFTLSAEIEYEGETHPIKFSGKLPESENGTVFIDYKIEKELAEEDGSEE